MKWLIGIVTVAVSLGTPGCTTPQPAEGATQFVFAEAQTRVFSGETSTNNPVTLNKAGTAVLQAQLKEGMRVAKLVNNAAKLKSVVGKVRKYAGKSWYVFGGATPSGWDCSGLVTWTYKQMGVNLYHSASAQMNSGKKVKTPKVGDLVAFSYGGRYAGHIGIYVGNGNFIHSPRPGVRTTIENVNRFAHNIGSRVVYTRILNTGSLEITLPPIKKHHKAALPKGVQLPLLG
jgi:cell wall-associated NlpC family hydrolase